MNESQIQERVQSLLYKKAEQIIESITDQERARLERAGWVLDLEEVFRALWKTISEHYDHKPFTLKQTKVDLKKITKKELFDL
ncbi:MAG: hypothetical protein ABIA37_04730 [Candidatus Woesearchaeota archaeon]